MSNKTTQKKLTAFVPKSFCAIKSEKTYSCKTENCPDQNFLILMLIFIGVRNLALSMLCNIIPIIIHLQIYIA